MTWIYWSLLSAFFAGATAILAKIGVANGDSNLATAIRTCVVLVFTWAIAIATSKPGALAQLTSRTWLFLGLSGLAALSSALGFHPARLQYALMTVVSITAVGAFDTAGSVLVVALMVAPPATARLLTVRLSRMLLSSALLGIGGAVLGWLAARRLDASIAGCMATAAGALFLLAFLLAPETGVLALARRRAERRRHFRRTMLAIHLLQHGRSPQAEDECRVDRLHLHLRWDREVVTQVVREAERAGEVQREGSLLMLTPAGQARAEEGIAG